MMIDFLKKILIRLSGAAFVLVWLAAFGNVTPFDFI